MADKWNAQDRKELEKYIKVFAFKVCQIIIQSRLGHKIRTECIPSSQGSDWFIRLNENYEVLRELDSGEKLEYAEMYPLKTKNPKLSKMMSLQDFNLAIFELPEITTETKKALYTDFETSKKIPITESIVNRFPLNVEISLRPECSERMVLEIWSLELKTDQVDLTQQVTVYGRLGELLKSALTVSRATPAYRYSRRQDQSDDYKIYYHIVSGAPQKDKLGHGSKSFSVGQVGTPIGTIKMAVAYRTNTTIGTDQLVRDNSLISAHGNRYLNDLSPTNNRNLNKAGDQKKVDLTKPMRLGAFVDLSLHKPYVDENCLLSETPPFWWLLPKSKEESSDSENLASSPTSTADTITTASSTKSSLLVAPNNNTNIARSPEKVVSTSPSKGSESAPNSLRDSRRSSTRSRVLSETIPLKPMCYPFATEKDKSTELAYFFLSCKQEPRLSQLQQQRAEEEGSSSEESIEDITEQLARFEESRKKFEDLTKYFKADEENNDDETDNNSNS